MNWMEHEEAVRRRPERVWLELSGHSDLEGVLLEAGGDPDAEYVRADLLAAAREEGLQEGLRQAKPTIDDAMVERAARSLMYNFPGFSRSWVDVAPEVKDKWRERALDALRAALEEKP